MDELSLASLLRGFEIGDKIVFKVNQSDTAQRRASLNSWALSESEIAMSGSKGKIVLVDYDPVNSPAYLLEIETYPNYFETVWVHDDEIVHQYEEHNN